MLLKHVLFPDYDYYQFSEAVYKRSTVPVFKAHGLAQASISDCVTETFSAIRTVSFLKFLYNNFFISHRSQSLSFRIQN